MRRLRQERGAVAVVVMLSIVALFGIGAVVVDVAALLQERRVLQNGADAGALAIAQQCGAGACGNPATSASSYANANAEDGTSTIEELCGVGVTGATSCPNPPTLPAGAKYVRVATKTAAAGGGDKVPFGFARIFGLTGMSVRAHAVAAWGGPSALTSALPVTMSECEFNRYTSNGTVLKPPPPYTSGYPSPEAVIYLHSNTAARHCPAGPSGADLPGGFGWLQTSSGCNATSDITNWFNDKTGQPPPSSCSPSAMAALVGTVVSLAVFDQTNGLSGSNGSYHMQGFAAFYVTGYSITGQYKVDSIATGKAPCKGSDTCISGFFVNSPAPVSGTIGGPSMGVTVVALVG